MVRGRATAGRPRCDAGQLDRRHHHGRQGPGHVQQRFRELAARHPRHRRRDRGLRQGQMEDRERKLQRPQVQRLPPRAQFRPRQAEPRHDVRRHEPARLRTSYGLRLPRTQGCSTLWDAEKVEEVIDATDGSAEAVLREGASAAGLEDVEGEAAEAGEEAGIAADAGAILAHGDVAAVVRGVLDPPVVSDGGCSANGGDRGGGEVEGGLGGAITKTEIGDAGENVALDADQGPDEGRPLGVREGGGGIEDGDAALLLSVAPAIAAAGRGERGGAGAEVLDLLMQGGLVVLELYDQVGSGLCGDVEGFVWQCRASSVTSRPAKPSSASSAWAAGISLDFSSTSLCTSAVSVANTPSRCAAARSRNASKLPRRVLPSIARLPPPGLAWAACNSLAWRRKAASTASLSKPCRM